MKLRTIGSGVALLVALGIQLNWAPVHAQQPEANPPPGPRQEVRVVQLRNAAASEVADVLREMLTGSRRQGGFRGAPGPASANVVQAHVSFDPRTNALILQAPAAELDGILAIVKAMDVERVSVPTLASDRVRIHRLRHATVDENLERLLGVATQGAATQGQIASFGLDRKRNLVVVSGDQGVLNATESLLKEIDVPGTDAKTPGELRVRVVWLAAGNVPEGAAKPPADLADVVAELAKLGIDKPWLAAQGLVNVVPNQQFVLDGTTRLDAPCQLSVVGVLSDGERTPTLQIELRVTKQVAAGSRFGPAGGGTNEVTVCQLRSLITTPAGQSVVLGVTPTDGTTSVFVVQVTKR